ncbi:hypothetical protein TNCV_1269001 [Trichonephila clavipes]|nr:hypothetical protein TNCV_1269001 [Trichonephila clavipes]
MSDDRWAASPCWAPWWVEAYWDEHKKILMEPHSKSPSVEHKFEFHDGRNLCCQRKQVDTTSENTVLAPLMVTKPSLVPSTTIPSADRVEQSTLLLNPEDSSCPVEGRTPSISPLGEHLFDTFESARFFVIKTQETFTNISPFLIEKAISGTVGNVKLIRKMRSGDLFLEVSSSTQAKSLANLKKTCSP